MDMTIDQLARQVDMTARAIRQWQTHGLLPPPTRRGRVGYYSHDHVALIQRIRKLRLEGFPLDLIRRIIDTTESPEPDVREMASAALSPFSEGDVAEIGRQELTERLGPDAERLLASLGWISIVGESVIVRNSAELNTLEKTVALGFSLERVVGMIVDAGKHTEAIAGLMTDMYVAEVWGPFVAAGFPADQWHAIADAASKVRPLVMEMAAHLFTSALDDVAGRVVLQQAGKLTEVWENASGDIGREE